MFHLKDFFYLQRNDRQAIMVLLGIVIVCITLVIVVGMLSPSSDGSFHNYPARSDKAASANERNATLKDNAYEKEHLYYKVDGVPHELFAFDPNTADSTQLLRLGLQPWQGRSIYGYRAISSVVSEELTLTCCPGFNFWG